MTAKNLWASLLASASASAVLLGVGQSALAAEIAGPTNVETIVVTGTRNQATDIKMQAPVILDIRPLEQIRSLPDVSAAEVLQRLPGIAMESDTGEGRFVNIRGMDADLNGTTFDGVRMMANNPATPQGGARAVGMDAFPAGLLGGVEVIKSLTPDIDAEGLGGVVNLQPRIIPPGADHIFDASLGGGVETLRPTTRYRADITAGRRFLDGKLSLILNYSLDQDHRAIDDVEEDYAYVNDGIDVPPGTSAHLGMKQFDNLQNRWYQYSRRREGYGGGITYDLTDDTGFYLRGFHDGYSEVAHKHELVLGNLGHNILSVSADGTYDASQTSLRYADINTHENLGNDLVEFGGHTAFGALKVDARGSWTQGYDTWPYSIYSSFSAPNSVDVIYNNSNPDHPTYQLVGGGSLVNPALYTQASGSNSPSQSTDTEYAGAVNFSLPLEFAHNDGLFKFGGEIRERTRRAQQYTGGDLNFPSQNLSDYVSGPDVLYYHELVQSGPATALRQAAVDPAGRDNAGPDDLRARQRERLRGICAVQRKLRRAGRHRRRPRRVNPRNLSGEHNHHGRVGRHHHHAERSQARLHQPVPGYRLQIPPQ
jgi:TonB-dependent receptor